MALWGNTDTAADAPKNLGAADLANTYFVDMTEAAVATNKAKGLDTGGWNLYTTYTDGTGAVRHKAECLVAMGVTAAVAGDVGVNGTDDLIVQDGDITINTQPLQADATIDIAGSASMTLTVAAASTNAGVAIAYKWKYSTDGGSTYEQDSIDNNNATFVVDSTETNEYVAGNMFYCEVSQAGSTTVNSTVVTLTQSA